VIRINFTKEGLLEALGYYHQTGPVVVQTLAAGSTLVNKYKKVPTHGILFQKILNFRKQ
jgi:hypothetical protein